MNNVVWDESDEVNQLRNARNSAAVLKLRLAKLRADLPDIIVLAFEGDDDAIVYYHWIKRLYSQLQYEPFPCNGKDGVLKLIDVVQRDLSGELNPVFYFLDRDFDDWKGRPPSKAAFMTDFYAVENYLVTETVLEDLLKTEFHCHGRPGIRRDVSGIFNADLQAFLLKATPFNERLFIAKQSGIRIESSLGKKIPPIAEVNLGAIKDGHKTPNELIRLEREPTDEEAAAYIDEFRALDPVSRHRGKYLLAFFQKWLGLLCDEAINPNLSTFAGIDSTSKPRKEELTIGNYASRSPVPEHLLEFLENIALVV